MRWKFRPISDSNRTRETSDALERTEEGRKLGHDQWLDGRPPLRELSKIKKKKLQRKTFPYSFPQRIFLLETIVELCLFGKLRHLPEHEA